MPETYHGPEDEPEVESSASGFTAVNGQVQEMPVSKAKAASESEQLRDEIEEKKSWDSGHEKPPENTALRRKENGLQQPSTPRNEFATDVPNNSKPPSEQQAMAPVSSPQKRKRSYAGDYGSSADQAYHNHGLPLSPQAPRNNDADNPHYRETNGAELYNSPQIHRSGPSPPPEPYHRPPSTYSRVYDLEPPRHPTERTEYAAYPRRPSQAERPYYNPQADVAESRLVEALQRENRTYDSGPRGGDFGSPEDDDDNPSHHYGEYGTNRSSQSGVEVDRKRRKRVFSNRTKTGCMTCRKRKKKCDEQHPECNNCLRGGFVCEGYTMRNTWQKPSSNKGPVPLQSKTGYADTPPRPIANHPRYAEDPSPEFLGRPQPTQQPTPASDGDRVQPIALDDDRCPSYPMASPPDAHAKPTWSKSTRPYPSNPPHLSKYQPGPPPISSVHENIQDAQDPYSTRPPPAPQRQSQTQYPVPSSNAHSSNSAPAVAKAALQHSTSIRPSPQRRIELTEREKMIKGEYYFPFSPTLVEDRERCQAAIWRFNISTNPHNGVSPEERSRLFRAILTSRPSGEQDRRSSDGRSSGTPGLNIPLPQGSVGERVIVEAPFHCDYGYNITIGDDVLIGADCRISDTCSVIIGARCIFSPNVKLVSAGYAIDPRRRMGSQGQALGRSITIEDDCWIGSNVTILPGVRVGKSSTVGAGSVIHKDVPRFTVVAGNPQKVVRGIYESRDD